jgi:SAM-dependent methyltransferase
MPRYEFAEMTEPDEFWQMLSESDALWYESAEDCEARFGRAQLLETVRLQVVSLKNASEREVLLAYLELGSFACSASLQKNGAPRRGKGRSSSLEKPPLFAVADGFHSLDGKRLDASRCLYYDAPYSGTHLARCPAAWSPSHLPPRQGTYPRLGDPAVNSIPFEDARRLYGDLSWTWPIISPVPDYVEEAEFFARAILEHSRRETRTLLDLGCGGGHLDHALKKHFAIAAVDVSEAMLDLARRLNPEIEYHWGDMRTVHLGRRFDAVIIHDSINYMITRDDLRAAFLTAYEHLEPEGLLVTFAEQTPDRFVQHKVQSSTHAKGDVEITFIEHFYDPDTADTTYESTFLYLIRRGRELQVEVDRHLCGIFDLRTWRDLLSGVGFEVEELEWEHSEFPPGESLPMFLCEKGRAA